MINLKEFKQSILQKAMQGKLTKQLPSDGNAEDLLVKIANKKRVLYQADKLKKSEAKPLPPITDKEIPSFKIPNNWEWTRLGNIGSWKSGSTPKRSNKSYYSGDIPWVKVQDLHNRYIEYTSEHISKKALIKCPLRLNPIGSILIAMYCGQAIGKLGITTQNMTTNQAICACVPYVVNNKFIFYYLMSQRNNLISMGAGGAQSNISRTKIIHYLIPLPPLSEQKRIVAKVHKCFEFADTIQKERELNKKFAHDMKQSLLMEAMQGNLTKQLPSDGTADELLQKIQQKKRALIKAGKIRRHKKLPPISKDEIPSNFNIPKNWKWVRLGDVSEINTGNTPSKSNKKYYSANDIPFVTPADLNNKFVKHTKRFLSNYAKSKARFANINSVFLIGIGGSIGKIGIATKISAFNQQIHNVYSYDLNMRYVYYMLLSFLVQKQLKSQSGTATPIINKTKFSKILISVPPLLEQNRIVSKLNDLFRFLDIKE